MKKFEATNQKDKKEKEEEEGQVKNMKIHNIKCNITCFSVAVPETQWLKKIENKKVENE